MAHILVSCPCAPVLSVNLEGDIRQTKAQIRTLNTSCVALSKLVTSLKLSSSVGLGVVETILPSSQQAPCTQDTSGAGDTGDMDFP